MPKVTEEHLESRREQILEGARHVFAQYGYHGATVARLESRRPACRGERSSTTSTTREDLFLELGLDANRRYVEAITVGGFAEAIREMAGESPDLIAVALELEIRLRENEEFRRRIEAGTAEQRKRLEAWFDEQRSSGEMRKDMEWDDLVRFAGIVVNGLAFRVSGGYETNVETVVRLLDDAIKPPQEPRR